MTSAYQPKVGQRYKNDDKILELIPLVEGQKYVGKVIEGKGWHRNNNPALFQHDYISQEDDTFWAFDPNADTEIPSIKEINYQIY